MLKYIPWKYTRFSFSLFLGLSLLFSYLIFTNNSSALRHDINTLPLLSETANGISGSMPGASRPGNPYFTIKWNNDNRPNKH